MAIPAAEALQLLQKANAHQRLAHAYLITGPEGSGKRQLAAQLCGLIVGNTEKPLEHPDVHTVEPESKSRRIVTEQIRGLEKQLQMRSSIGGRKVGVILDADRLQPQASNAFLKTLEEPPAQSHLVLVTSLPDQLLETILSRCIEVPLRATSRPSRPRGRKSCWICSRATRGKKSRSFRRSSVSWRSSSDCSRKRRKRRRNPPPKSRRRRRNTTSRSRIRSGSMSGRTTSRRSAEARYIAERTRLLDTLEQWWADVLRHQAHAGRSPRALPHCSISLIRGGHCRTRGEALTR